AGVAQDRFHALVGRAADAPVAVELLDEGIDGLLVLGRLGRGAPGAQLADGLGLHPFLLGDPGVGSPLVLRLPVRGGREDREFREARRDAGAESQMGAELLGELAEGRCMQVAVERPAHLELSAGTRADRFDERPLRRRERFFRNGGQARRRLLACGHGISSNGLFWSALSPYIVFQPGGITLREGPGPWITSNNYRRSASCSCRSAPRPTRPAASPISTRSISTSSRRRSSRPAWSRSAPTRRRSAAPSTSRCSSG